MGVFQRVVEPPGMAAPSRGRTGRRTARRNPAAPTPPCAREPGGSNGARTIQSSCSASTGLEGVSIGETEIALVDGENGRLIYRGHDAERLADESTFEETAFLLWNGRLPDDAELAELRSARGRRHGRAARGARRDPLARQRRAADGRAAHGSLGVGRAARHAPRAATATTRSGRSRPTPAIVADFARLRPGTGASRPIPSSGSVENYLLKLSGDAPGRRAGPRARRVLHPRAPSTA